MRRMRRMRPVSVFAKGPDSQIEQLRADLQGRWRQAARAVMVLLHPLRLAKDNLTAVMGVMKGTFSKPMPDGKGGTIAPTGKVFAVDMVTVGIWNRQDTMDEEFLFWDNQTFYGEMGLS